MWAATRLRNWRCAWRRRSRLTSRRRSKPPAGSCWWTNTTLPAAESSRKWFMMTRSSSARKRAAGTLPGSRAKWGSKSGRSSTATGPPSGWSPAGDTPASPFWPRNLRPGWSPMGATPTCSTERISGAAWMQTFRRENEARQRKWPGATGKSPGCWPTPA